MAKKRIPANIFKTPLCWAMRAREIILYTAIVEQEPETISELEKITGMSKKTTQAGVRDLVKMDLITSRRDYKRREMIIGLVEEQRPASFILMDKGLFNYFSRTSTPDEFKFILLLKHQAGKSGKIETTKRALAIGCGITTDAAERYIRDLSKAYLLNYKYSGEKLSISIDF